jgi:hypothetical protein
VSSRNLKLHVNYVINLKECPAGIKMWFRLYKDESQGEK